MPCDVVKSTDIPPMPLIAIKMEHETKHFTPIEISAMILRQVKEETERFVGHEFQKAVITVPAYFNNGHR